MWPWLRRWLDCAMMNEMWPFSRGGPRPQGLYFGYEKGGLVIHDQPIPWNAEAVLVEALLRLPPRCSRRKNDYLLRLSGQEPIPAENLRRQDGEDRYHVQFRFRPPGTAVQGELLYRNHPRGRVALPFLSKEAFLRQLDLQLPTLSVRLGSESIACQTFVSSQCQGLMASAMLNSPTSLVPIVDLDLQVELDCEQSEGIVRTPACLSRTQLQGRQALVTVAFGRSPRRRGNWEIRWLVGESVLARQGIRGITTRDFERSLRISDTRFVVQTTGGAVFLARQVPPLDSIRRLGPCFLLASSETGMAGQCLMQITAQLTGAVGAPLLWEQEVLITDGPTAVAPGTLDTTELEQVLGFELKIGGRPLGVLSLCPAPTASFTSEGGYRTPGEYTWSAAAEEEMNDRLNRLFSEDDKMTR
jgi:hypothetical protein